MKPPSLPHHAPHVAAAVVFASLLLFGSLVVKALLRLPQPGPPALAAGQVLGQLIAASLAMDLVLGDVDVAGFLDDLGGDLLVAADGLVSGSRGELAAVDGDHPHLDQFGLCAEAENLAEEVAKAAGLK